MAWELPSTFRGQKSWFIEKYWIKNNQNKRNTKTCGFCMQKIRLVIHQIKENIKDDIWRCHQHIVRKYHKTYFFIFFKILFWIIYCFKVLSCFKLDICSLPRNWTSRSLTEHPVFFVTEVDRAGNLSTNIWNIVQCLRMWFHRAHTCSKFINKWIIIYYGRTRNNYIICQLHSK